jgi:hypothetical protein
MKTGTATTPYYKGRGPAKQPGLVSNENFPGFNQLVDRGDIVNVQGVEITPSDINSVTIAEAEEYLEGIGFMEALKAMLIFEKQNKGRSAIVAAIRKRMTILSRS